MRLNRIAPLVAKRRQGYFWPSQKVKRVQLGRMLHSLQHCPKVSVVSSTGEAAQSPQYWLSRDKHASAWRIRGDGIINNQRKPHKNARHNAVQGPVALQMDLIGQSECRCTPGGGGGGDALGGGADWGGGGDDLGGGEGGGGLGSGVNGIRDWSATGGAIRALEVL